MEVAAPSVLWSTLSTDKKKWGIHPAELSTIQFNVSEGDLSEKVLKQLQRFFLGCRLATTDDYLKNFVISLNSNGLVDERIKDIAHRSLSTQRPEERRLEKDSYHSYPITFKGEGTGSEYCQYEEKFADLYNKLVDEEQCHLMHPSRRLELIQYLEGKFPNPEITAERLITYRCFGYYALEISELKRSVKQLLSKRKEVEGKIAALCESGPNMIADPQKLKEKDLSCISDRISYRLGDRYCRIHVLIAFRKLASEGLLEVLDLPKKELYYSLEGTKGITHPSLVDSAKAYYDNHCYLHRHFGEVVKYLKMLRSNDLNVLIKHCLSEEIERLKWLINFYQEDQLVKAETNYKTQLLSREKEPQNYNPGDFSFLSDPQTICTLTNAYKAVEKLNVWPFFDIEPPEDSGYMFWDHPTINQIAQELRSDVHTLTSAGFTMRWMQKIRNKGWQVVVSESLEESAQMLGLLNRIRL